jgi:hypothetical protein
MPAGSMYHRPAWPCGVDAKAFEWPKERNRLRASERGPAVCARRAARPAQSVVARWPGVLGPRLQILLARFDSGPRLQRTRITVASMVRFFCLHIRAHWLHTRCAAWHSLQAATKVRATGSALLPGKRCEADAAVFAHQVLPNDVSTGVQSLRESLHQSPFFMAIVSSLLSLRSPTGCGNQRDDGVLQTFLGSTAGCFMTRAHAGCRDVSGQTPSPTSISLNVR